ncbi:MAG: hypothetical protein ACFE9V_05660, partial [Candidatus Hodarchaeota archaeon]
MNLNSFDFDLETQEIFNKQFSDIKSIDWKNWLEISSKEEYEELVLKNSGLIAINDVFEKIKKEETNPKELSIDLYYFLKKYQTSEPPIVCHSSGTTNNNLSALKWLHMSKNIVQKYWAPGMQAIFESGGLDSNSSVVIFVPSRLKNDGLNFYEGRDYISLYSSEFSQRIMLSIVKPKSYLFYEYKYSKNLEIISQILTMEEISVISAPAITILGWADINRLKTGLKKSVDLLKQTRNSQLDQLILEIKRKGLESTARRLQSKLSEK